ncbi:MAG: DNA translocase FtsK, partial [Spirochaetota bacterium]|nr:DNA translocase FtsK [Spirochaetota bacterium]
ISIIVLLSLLDFSINDHDLLKRNNTVSNVIGPIGAYISYLLRSAFGYSSLFISVVFAITGWSVIRKKKTTDILERVFALFYLMISSSMLISLLTSSSIIQFSGGYIGLYLSTFFNRLFGSLGAYLIIFIMNLIGFILLGIISVSSMLEHGGNGNKKFFQLLKRISRKIINYYRRRKIPLNYIEKETQRIKGRIPWIVKKKIILNDYEYEPSIKVELPKLLELKEPLPSGLDISSFLEENLPRSEGIDMVDDSIIYSEPSSFIEPINNAVDVEEAFELDQATKTLPDKENERSDLPDQYRESSVEYNCKDASSRIKYNRIIGVESDKSACSVIPPDQLMEVDEDGSNFDSTVFDDDVEMETINSENRVFENITIDRNYIIPTSFLRTSAPVDYESWKIEVKKNSELLVNTLKDFGIESRVINVNRGPVLTLYEMQIAPGIKINRIVSLSDDITMALAASRVRIVAPIPGKSAIGVEVPNKKREMVTMGDIINMPDYKSSSGKLKVALGKDIFGNPIMLDIKKLPHLLIAGATGAGKSVCVNSIITSIIYNYDPNHVRFILIDPKMVELQLYNGMPHLLTPVITEVAIAPKALKWAMYEMERRYRLLSEVNTRDIDKYNEKITKYGDQFERLPFILIIMDEMADLMMIAAKEIEGFIIRIAQKARAVGIHLVLATQRPSVDVITGVIKANFPARIAFQVAQKTDSRTIIDQNGAEKLLGKGDMLYQSPMNSFPIRIQGSFISEEEIMQVVGHLKTMGKPKYIDIEDDVAEEEAIDNDDGIQDELFVEAIKIVEESKKASASYLQRRLSIGYNRAARIVELMEERGYVGPLQGSKPREVFI